MAKGDHIPQGWLGQVDQWMASHPAFPRATPYFVFVGGLFLINALRDQWAISYLPSYLILNILIAWMMWRYRRLTPELNLKFHWLAVPVGVVVFALWVWIGQQMRAFGEGNDVDTGWNFFKHLGEGFWGWTGMVMRLVGMSILVPLFEELFIRSLLLRCFYRAKRTLRGFGQILIDFPMIGDMLIHTEWARRLDEHPVLFRSEFEATPVGELSVFGVMVSTLLFTFGHRIPDWPGAILCGVVYCLLLRVTRHKGLGPVVWAHGITNALLWIYVLKTDGWSFL